MTTIDQRNQQLENQYNAAGNINFYHSAPLRQIDSAIIKAAEERFAALPLESIPDGAPLLAGSLLPAQNPLFVGRRTDLQALATILKGDNKRVAVTGIGVVGKTQLVIEFV